MTSVLFAFLIDPAGLEWLDLAVLAGVFLLGVALAAAWPPLLLRPLAWLLTHSIYRLSVQGRENVPATGPALLVCNKVNYIDWMLIWASCPRRVRLVAWSNGSRWRLPGFLLRLTRAIPLDGRAGPRALVKGLREIARALNEGEVVCVFPEASRDASTGAPFAFQQGYERVLKNARRPIPVIPTCLSQIWGSIFNYRRGKWIWKWPERIPYPAAVQYGVPLPSSIACPEIRLKVQELGAETAIRESRRSRPVHREFVRVAARFGNLFRTCFIDCSGPAPRALSYAKALVGSICVARWLAPQLGEAKNVGLWLPSSVGNGLANIALTMLGKTSVNLNYTAAVESNRSAIEQTGMQVVVTSRRFLARMPLQQGDRVKLIHLEDAAAGISAWRRLRTFLAVLLLPGWFLEYVVLGLGKHRLQDILTIVFSSGSTGEPKGVTLSHANVAANVEAFSAHTDLNPHDRLLGVLPFFHSFGYTTMLWAPIMIGASAVYHPDPRQAKEIGDLCRTYSCTGFVGTATFLRFYLRRCDPQDFRSLRLLICGAEKLPVGLAREFEAKFGVLPLEGYGCTELSPVAASNVQDLEIEGVIRIGNKPGSVGHPIPGVAAKIVHPETHEPLRPGQEGLLLMKGPNVMMGYLGKPEWTAQVVLAGWYVTGDMGRTDEDGFVILTGRIARFAKIAGEMIPLEKIEEDIHAVLGAAERVVAVTSVPDAKRGERLIVLHLPSLSLTPEQLTRKLSERPLPALWIPGEHDFHAIAELPLLGTGKLDLRKVKETALALTG